MKNHGRATDAGVLGKLLSLVGGTIVVILAVMFSLVVLAVIVVVGIGVWIYFRWKTRELRQTLRERPPGGHVIDGEVVVVDEPGIDPPRGLPRDGP